LTRISLAALTDTEDDDVSDIDQALGVRRK
jgi:hypothetical protein